MFKYLLMSACPQQSPSLPAICAHCDYCLKYYSILLIWLKYRWSLGPGFSIIPYDTYLLWIASSPTPTTMGPSATRTNILRSVCLLDSKLLEALSCLVLTWITARAIISLWWEINYCILNECVLIPQVFGNRSREKKKKKEKIYLERKFHINPKAWSV